MGCTNSREAERDRPQSPSPFVRIFSVSVSIGSQRKGDSFNTAALHLFDEEMTKSTNDHKNLVSTEIRVSNTPATSLHYQLEPEIINAWELMDGLEDITPLRPSFASNTLEESARCSPVKSASEDYEGFDLDIISGFRKAITELSPEEASFEENEILKFAGIVDAQKPMVSPLKKSPPGGERKLVLYLTSLRGVRKTFEDCWNVRVILQGYGFRVDERDVSMHGGFKDELLEILGPGYCGSNLPRVFADGKYIGGAEEVMRMHEAGELEEALRDCEVVAMENGCSVVNCEGCGDVRFVPCEICSGSCKVFVEEEEEGEVEIGGFRRCSECNENGLVRCPLCCY
ncbi:uncharacterized protein At3g28850-like [Phalaenopsis equestris]|uniref:uncharacterized protein At3g28850-like n=1 Tax=Phalaenopsis equestris TaxID=78828 RepID=UPI0009E23394|nr:uncharacterized protein At3g28850-like [Phalaenopsis equestris]